MASGRAMLTSTTNHRSTPARLGCPDAARRAASMRPTAPATAKLYSTNPVVWKNAMYAPKVAKAIHPMSAANGFGCARQASATALLQVTAKASDCARVGQRNAHNNAPATPPATATQVIATGTGPRGPSLPASNVTRHSTIDAAMDDIR